MAMGLLPLLHTSAHMHRLLSHPLRIRASRRDLALFWQPVRDARVILPRNEVY
jgi:hypothetical protein